MKKIVLAFIFIATILQAEVIQGSVIGGENTAYWILDDGSFWKVFSFVKRWRGPLEWFRGDDLGVPDSYQTSLDQWVSGTEIAVMSKSEVAADFTNASNQEDLRQATHVIVHKHTGHTLFALSMSANHFLTSVFNEGKLLGRSESYEKGKQDGFQRGFALGECEGYEKGFTEGQVQQRRLFQNPHTHQNPPPPSYESAVGRF
jgi:hypothetical protein